MSRREQNKVDVSKRKEISFLGLKRTQILRKGQIRNSLPAYPFAGERHPHANHSELSLSLTRYRPLHTTAPRQPLLGTSTIPRVRPAGDRRAAREDMSCRDSEVCDGHDNMSSMNMADERCDLGATGFAYYDCGSRVLEAAPWSA